MFKATINVALKDSVLDPQGQTALHALQTLGIKEALDLRVGKQFILKINSANEAEARASAEKICEKVLVNPIIEKYFIELEPLEGTS